MHILLSDEAGSADKGIQSIATLLIPEQELESLNTMLEKHQASDGEFKFARVRNNVTYLDDVKNLLTDFFDALKDIDSSLVIIVGKSSESMYTDMYEEVFLLAQANADDQIQFRPDQNNSLQRWTKSGLFKQYSIVGCEEQDSKKNQLIQVMDILAGISIFLAEHHGTYEIWKQSDNRYEQLEEFERELHIRCELVHHFFQLLESHYGECKQYPGGVWTVDSPDVMMLEY